MGIDAAIDKQTALKWLAEGNAHVPYRMFSDPGSMAQTCLAAINVVS
jgi:hypothetical protein